MSFLKAFCITFPLVWFGITLIQAGATHKPFAQCLSSWRLDCE
jgi:hypothetical protein